MDGICSCCAVPLHSFAPIIHGRPAVIQLEENRRRGICISTYQSKGRLASRTVVGIDDVDISIPTVPANPNAQSAKLNLRRLADIESTAIRYAVIDCGRCCRACGGSCLGEIAARLTSQPASTRRGATIPLRTHGVQIADSMTGRGAAVWSRRNRSSNTGEGQTVDIVQKRTNRNPRDQNRVRGSTDKPDILSALRREVGNERVGLKRRAARLGVVVRAVIVQPNLE